MATTNLFRGIGIHPHKLSAVRHFQRFDGQWHAFRRRAAPSPSDVQIVLHIDRADKSFLGDEIQTGPASHPVESLTRLGDALAIHLVTSVNAWQSNRLNH